MEDSSKSEFKEKIRAAFAKAAAKPGLEAFPDKPTTPPNKFNTNPDEWQAVPRFGKKTLFEFEKSAFDSFQQREFKPGDFKLSKKQQDYMKAFLERSSLLMNRLNFDGATLFETAEQEEASPDVDYNDPAVFNEHLQRTFVPESFEREKSKDFYILKDAIKKKLVDHDAAARMVNEYIVANIGSLNTRHATRIFHHMDADDFFTKTTPAAPAARALLRDALDHAPLDEMRQIIMTVEQISPSVHKKMGKAIAAGWQRQVDSTFAMYQQGDDLDAIRNRIITFNHVLPEESSLALTGQITQMALKDGKTAFAMRLADAIPSQNREKFFRTQLQPSHIEALARHMLAEAVRNHGDSLVSYDKFVRRMGSLLTEAGPSLDAARTAAVKEKTVALFNKVQESFFAENNGSAGWETLEQVGRLTGVDAAMLRKGLTEITDRFLKSGDAEQALFFATDPDLVTEMHVPDVLSAAQAEAIAERLLQDGNKAALGQLAHYIAANRPDLKTLGERLQVESEPLTPNEVIAQLAPILTSDGNGAAKLARFIRAIPHETTSQAQADMLQDVWDALEQADKDIKPITGHGREDIPMTADNLRNLSLSVSRYMGVMQTQMPLIMGADMSSASWLNVAAMRTPSLSRAMTFSETNVTGSSVQIMSEADGTDSHGSGFGFLTIKHKEPVTIDGQCIVQEKMTAMPVISIDPKLFDLTMNNDGEEILLNLQQIAALFNHDYFHHFTARVINPYFFNQGAIDLKKTPFGHLMGKERILKGTIPKEGLGSYLDNDPPARGMEQYRRFQNEQYGKNSDWKKFSQGSANYEYHALHLHNVLYQQYLDKGPAGERMRHYVDGYIDGVKALGERLAAAAVPAAKIDDMKIYYANLLAFHLRRIVPHDHPLMVHAEKGIDRLDIDLPHMRNTIAADVKRLIAHGYAKRFESVQKQVGIDPTAPDLTAAQAARWRGCLSAVNILNLLHSDKYAEAREQALPALRQSISVVARDMKAVEYRGGLDAFYSYKAQDKKKSPWERPVPPRAGVDENSPGDPSAGYKNTPAP